MTIGFEKLNLTINDTPLVGILDLVILTFGVCCLLEVFDATWFWGTWIVFLFVVGVTQNIFTICKGS